MNTPTVQSEPTAVPTQAAPYNGAPTPQGRAFSRTKLAFLIGVPLLWGILLLFHPGGDGTEI
jgi:hypothetical protein